MPQIYARRLLLRWSRVSPIIFGRVGIRSITSAKPNLAIELGKMMPASEEVTGTRRLLQVQSLTQEFVVSGHLASITRRNRVQAVSGVTFDIGYRETVGIVGETGCGKSTLARSIMQAPKPKAGEVILGGTELTTLGRKALRSARRNIQMVFQDPYSSLDPRWSILDQVMEPLTIHKIGSKPERHKRATELLGLVGLDPKRIGSRKPREVSGGECQRVAMARALALSPQLVVLDEPVSAMDVFGAGSSTQSP